MTSNELILLGLYISCQITGISLILKPARWLKISISVSKNQVLFWMRGNMRSTTAWLIALKPQGASFALSLNNILRIMRKLKEKIFRLSERLTWELCAKREPIATSQPFFMRSINSGNDFKLVDKSASIKT